MSQRIFISIPSYCDKQLIPTIENLFNQSLSPEKLTIVVCHQNNQTELKLFKDFIFKHPRSDQIHTIDVLYTEARGPIFARYLIQQQCLIINQINNHKYFLSIDSHMRFIKGWDHHLIKELHECLKKSRSPILSCYPGEYELLNQYDVIKHQQEPNLLHFSHFDSDQMPRIVGKRDKSAMKEPIPCHFLAAGFYFCFITILMNATYPNDYDFLFFGEEFLISSLVFEQGYKIFCPTKNICYHLWKRSQRSLPSIPSSLLDVCDSDPYARYQIKRVSQEKLIDFLRTQTKFIESIQHLLPSEKNPFIEKIKQ